ncbi:uncharacterized protein LOC135153666 [Lytechinus pictus]|uniref:uncharacterized protein LOC135153666 n=1 Tax=Lytechinus pictus TaxID=7653 RepID=UPI0030B9C442
MAKTRAEIQAAYRERKRKIIGERAYLEHERRRVKKYYIPVEKLTKTQLKERRQTVNKRVKKHRKRVAEVLSKIRKDSDNRNAVDVADNADGNRSALDESADSALSDVSFDRPTTRSSASLVVKLPFALRKSRRKRRSKCLDKAHKRIESLTHQLKAATKTNKRVQKRYERLLKRQTDSHLTTSTPANTPKSKMKSMLKRCGLPEKRCSKEIKKHLLFSNAILVEIQTASRKRKTKDYRRMLHNVVAGSRVMKKYRLLSFFQKSSGLGRRNLTNAGKSVWSGVKTKPIWTSLHEEIKAFFERDDVSRVMPGKKDACKGKDGIKLQKRYLCDYVGNLHAKYISENAEKRNVSRSAFHRVRKNLCSHIKLVQFASRNSCLCKRHQNVALQLKALKALNCVNTTNPDQFIRDNDDSAVDAALNSLQADVNVDFEQWKRSPDDEGRIKTRLVRVSATKEDLLTQFPKEIQELRSHVRRVHNQYEAMTKCKENLAADHCIVHMDFSENYVCAAEEEVQSAYWSQESVTIHPIVVYYRDVDGNLVHRSLVAISDERAHNTSTILAIITKVIPQLREMVPTLSKVFYWTDSPSSQYRNKTMFAVVGEHRALYGIDAQWDYFEAGHGKGACDGIGGTVKRLADEAVKRRAAVIMNAHDFFAWASQERHDNPSNYKITYFFITKKDCSDCAEIIAQKWSCLKSVKGTMDIHSVIGMGSEDLHVLLRNTSCFCEKCVVKDGEYDVNLMCSGWRREHLSRRGARSSECERAPTTSKRKVKPVQIQFDTDDWVAAMYAEKWYIGKVLQTDKNDVHIDFMKSSEKFPDLFKWPSVSDKIWVSRDKMLCHITPLKRSTSSKRLFELSDGDRRSIEKEKDLYMSRLK